MSGVLLIDEVLPASSAEAERQVLPRAILLVEDDAARSTRRHVPGISEDNTVLPVTVRLHRIVGSKPELVAERAYAAGETDGNAGRTAVAFQLVDSLDTSVPASILIAGTHYGATAGFLQGLAQRELDFAVELPPSALVQPAEADYRDLTEPKKVLDLFWQAKWHNAQVVHPTTERVVSYLWADLGPVVRHGIAARLFVVQTGNVKKVQPGTIFVLANCFQSDPGSIVQTIAWTRWIRPLVRKSERTTKADQSTNTAISNTVVVAEEPHAPVVTTVPGDPGATAEEAIPQLAPQAEAGAEAPRDLVIPFRVNITLSRQRDEAANGTLPLTTETTALRGALARGRGVLRLAELFAGGGGMGLGFLTAGGAGGCYRLVCSGEVHPIYVQTLQRNHTYFQQQFRPDCPNAVPQATEPLNLRRPEAFQAVEAACRAEGGIDVLIGGPPCQGLSSANRNSGSANNPHNELIDVYLEYVERLRPSVFLMENVQGIVWTPKNGNPDQLTVAEDFTRRTRDAGYLVFPKLLDAAWFGVPQHRNRVFVLGISLDLGYEHADFGDWGPFPQPSHWPGTERPYVTVREAIWDLPHLINGDCEAEMPYRPEPQQLANNRYLQLMRTGAPEDVIWDHITSRHAPYVIERYDNIPEGENWQSIENLLSNYADIGRTHSNIYRKLARNEPSITIGHYRKSMIVHPAQSRGLSLREACRLMSFPDWFRFIGTLDGTPGGITHQQQQVANAVCPLVTRAIADFILRL